MLFLFTFLGCSSESVSRETQAKLDQEKEDCVLLASVGDIYCSSGRSSQADNQSASGFELVTEVYKRVLEGF